MCVDVREPNKKRGGEVRVCVDVREPNKKRGGEVTVCVDMREPNKAIGREKHPMPTLDDLIVDLNVCVCVVHWHCTAQLSMFNPLMPTVPFLGRITFQWLCLK